MVLAGHTCRFASPKRPFGDAKRPLWQRETGRFEPQKHTAPQAIASQAVAKNTPNCEKSLHQSPANGPTSRPNAAPQNGVSPILHFTAADSLVIFVSLHNASCTRETESKLSFLSFALPLQNASCTARQRKGLRPKIMVQPCGLQAPTNQQKRWRTTKNC